MKNKKWTIQDIPDLSDKTIIVTGGNSGLGFESVKAFASHGAKVILACRSEAKGQKAKDTIVLKYPQSRIEVMPLDLADLASIRTFAEAFTKKHDQLDILLNNAGIMMTPYGLTKDGFEQQLGTNHLGHFALTGRLFNLLKSTPNARIVNVSSAAHRWGVMDFEHLFFENEGGYTPTKAYGRSKLANLLFTYELQRRIETTNLQLMAVAAHPGAAKTNLTHFVEGKWWYKVLNPIVGMMVQNQAQGAMPQIRAATDPGVRGAEYYGPSGLREMSGHPVKVASNPASHDTADAKRLWVISEKLTGVEFEF